MDKWNEMKDKYDYSGDPLAEVKQKMSNGLVFFHIPKSGGTWFNITFMESDGITYSSKQEKYCYIHGHDSVRLHRRMQKNEIYSQLKRKNWLNVSIVRNPFDILPSMWFMSGDSGFGWWDCRRTASTVQGFLKSFPDKRIKIDPEPSKISSFKRCLFHQALNSASECEIDVFIRYERLEEGLKKLFDRDLVEEKIKTIVNAGSRDADYRKYYDLESRKIVEEAYAWELEQFGYSFDGETDQRCLIFGNEISTPSLDS